MRERWIPGLWLGKRWATDEHVVSVASGRVVRARDVRLFSPDRAFDLEFVKNVVGTPSNPSAVEDEDTTWHDIPRAPVEQDVEPSVLPAARRVILHRSYFEKFGFSSSCTKCRALMRNDDSPQQRAHTVDCRNRIEAAMVKDPMLAWRLQAADARMNRFCESEVKRGDTRGDDAMATETSGNQETTTSAETEDKRDPDDDGIKEVDENDGDEVDDVSKHARDENDGDEVDSASKRARIESTGVGSSGVIQERVERSAEEETEAQRQDVNIDDSEEPDAKRMRSSTLSMEKPTVGGAKSVSWADLTESESPELSLNGPSRSDANGLACADDGSPGKSKTDDAMR